MTKAILIAALLAAPATASSPAAWAALDKTSSAACAKASGLENALVGPAVRFSDSFGVDVREVTGKYKPKHMRGAKGRMLCLIERKTGRVEAQEKPSR